MDLQIRKAIPEDAEVLIKIYNEAFYEDYVRYGECPAYGRSVDDMKKSIIEVPKHIAFVDSTPIGVISVKETAPHIYYIGCLCVIPEFQRKGIGHQLIEFMKTQYSDWKKIELITPIDKEKNVKFYTEKCGFMIDNEEMDSSVKVYHFSMYRKLTRYIALLRGINISGKNKISMPELKAALIEKGFSEVSTYLNSGNIIFSDVETDTIVLADKIKTLIQEKFTLDIPVFVIAQSELKTLLTKAPAWWGTDSKDIYDNLIFVIPPHRIETVAEKIGEPTAELEKVEICGNAAFWSFDRKLYAKANWWKKTAAAGIGEMITIRTTNTLWKIAEM